MVIAHCSLLSPPRLFRDIFEGVQDRFDPRGIVLPLFSQYLVKNKDLVRFGKGVYPSLIVLNPFQGVSRVFFSRKRDAFKETGSLGPIPALTVFP